MSSSSELLIDNAIWWLQMIQYVDKVEFVSVSVKVPQVLHFDLKKPRNDHLT